MSHSLAARLLFRAHLGLKSTDLFCNLTSAVFSLHKSRDVKQADHYNMAGLSSDLILCSWQKIMLFSRTHAVRNVHLAVTSLWFKGKTVQEPKKCYKRGLADMWPTPLFAHQAG